MPRDEIATCAAELFRAFGPEALDLITKMADRHRDAGDLESAFTCRLVASELEKILDDTSVP